MKKAVVGYNGLYEVDNLGNIYSLKNNKILSQRNDQRGYLISTLYINGLKKTIKVHRIVANAFIDNKNNYPQINHIDGNKKNNCCENLEWCTGKQNLRHAKINGLIKNINFDGFIAKNIKTGEIIKFATQNDAESMGFDSSTISKCCRGTRKKHKGFTWSYESCRRAV